MCGGRQAAPGLPPRPPIGDDADPDVCAVQLPSRNSTHSSQGSPVNGRYTTPRMRPSTLDRSSSASFSASQLSDQPSVTSRQLSDQSSVTSPVATEPPPDYVNLSIEEQLWFSGELDRVEAEGALENRPPGTFLVRVSAAQDNKFVLSLRSADKVSHMKIRQSDETLTSYSLSPARQFTSIIQLIQFYQQHSLSENFSGLHMMLRRPWRQDDLAVVKFKYTPNGRAPNVLSLNVGDQVVILSRDSESQGWWKGKIGDRVGYFPKSYVHELD